MTFLRVVMDRTFGRRWSAVGISVATRRGVDLDLGLADVAVIFQRPSAFETYGNSYLR
jgi:hypothetical protein